MDGKRHAEGQARNLVREIPFSACGHRARPEHGSLESHSGVCADGPQRVDVAAAVMFCCIWLCETLVNVPPSPTSIYERVVRKGERVSVCVYVYAHGKKIARDDYVIIRWAPPTPAILGHQRTQHNIYIVRPS